MISSMGHFTKQTTKKKIASKIQFQLFILNFDDFIFEVFPNIDKNEHGWKF